eukprot:SAG11_NODE_17866_length_507_cov_0.546569_1_plen_103_part_10
MRELLTQLKSATSGTLAADNAANAKIAERMDLLMQQIIEREQDAIEVGSDCFTKVSMRIGAAQKNAKISSVSRVFPSLFLSPCVPFSLCPHVFLSLSVPVCSF